MRVARNVPNRTTRTQFGVPRAEDDTADVRLQTSAGTHGARFERDNKCAISEIPSAKRSGGLTHGLHFGVGERIGMRLAQVASTSDRTAVRIKYDGADRHFAVRGGFAGERVLRAPDDGVFHQLHEIGDLVEAGETVGEVNGKPMACTISGVLRGILADGTPVFKGMKSGDVDPRAQVENCYTASDKAIAIGGGVLQAILEYTGVLRGVAGRNALEV